VLGVKLDDYCGKKIFNFGIRVVKKYIDRARHLKRKISRNQIYVKSLPQIWWPIRTCEKMD